MSNNATNMGRVQQYVSQSKYKDRFFNLDAGSDEFTKEWKKIAEEHPVDFRKEQHQFIKTADFGRFSLYVLVSEL